MCYLPWLAMSGGYDEFRVDQHSATLVFNKQTEPRSLFDENLCGEYGNLLVKYS